MRWLSLVAVLAVTTAVSHAQSSSAPFIYSVQSSFTESPAAFGPAITAGTPSANVWLYINGLFNTQSSNTTNWTGVGAPTGQTLKPVSTTSSQLIVDLPSNLFAAAGTATITVTQGGFSTGIISNGITFTVNPQLAAQSLPAGVVNQPYSQLLATGGTPPYTLQLVSGTPPPGISSPNQSAQNSPTLSGTPTAAGAYTFSIQILDAWENAITTNDALTIGFPPLSITTASPLSPATAGSPYAGVTFAATGGDVRSYSFSLASGAFPAGMTMNSSGQLTGTPTTAGTAQFTIRVTDASNNAATKPFTLLVNPGPLTITTPSFSSMAVGTALNVTFGAQGGVPPYTFSSSGTLPPNAQFNASGQLTATLNTPGTYPFSVTVTDSAKTTASRNYTITVTGNALSISTTSLPAGQVGVAYPGTQLQATGGLSPYTWTATGIPPGLTLAADGTLSGAPTTAGSYTISATVTDSAKAIASARIPIAIQLTITTASLPNGTLGVAYSAPNLAAAGGAGTLTWSASGLPAGITLSAAGVFGGTPTAAGTSQVGVTVADAQGNKGSQSYTITVAAAPLSIVPRGSVPTATVGSSFSMPFDASGGVSPYTFFASGLPAGTASSSTNNTVTISGTPTAPGSFSITVSVKDGAGATASATVTVNVSLPATPPLTITGVGATLNPGSQSNVGASLGSAYPVDVAVTLTLKFSGTDPAVQFATGGTSTTLTVPAGKTASATNVGVQTGTVAGTITITAKLAAAGADITPSPAPSSTVTVPPTAPAITSMTATRNSTGFTVTIVGYSNTLALSTANFTFTGSNLGTTSLSLSVNPIFAAWYGGSTAGQFGSAFTYTQPFTTSNPQAVTSVSVTLVNGTGTSTSASATLQ